MRVVVSHLALLLLFASAARAQTNFYTIQTNGPASNRLNVIFLAEGYTSSQFSLFLSNVTNALNAFFGAAPYAEYRPYCNTFAIAVASAQSGSDHPVANTFSNTFFNSTYGPTDYIMSIPTNSTGQGKVDVLLNLYMPAHNLAILLVNDSAVGGSDGGGKTAIAAVSSQVNDLLLHECGHVLANLGDEYTDPYPGYPDVEEPNTTRETNRAAIKWNAWISTNTPIPTPASGTYASTVGLFEGAHYHTTGWYRPRLNCRMASYFTGFYCDVCTEALVLSVYRQVRPIDSYTPTSTNLLTSLPTALNFALTVLQPASHALNVQWLTNSVPVPGATNSAFSILPLALGNGTNTVRAQVTDPTPLVRTDTSNLLSQTLTWTVAVNVPQLQLSQARWLESGKFAFRISGIAPQGFAVQASTNLTSWTSLSTNSLVGGQFEYTNSNASAFPYRAFRAVTPPQ